MAVGAMAGPGASEVRKLGVPYRLAAAAGGRSRVRRARFAKAAGAARKIRRLFRGRADKQVVEPAALFAAELPWRDAEVRQLRNSAVRSHGAFVPSVPADLALCQLPLKDGHWLRLVWAPLKAWARE